MNPQRIEALLRVRSQIASDGIFEGLPAPPLSCPSLNSSILIKEKALSESLALPRLTSQDIQKEVQRLKAMGHAHIQSGYRDTVEASLVFLSTSDLVRGCIHSLLNPMLEMLTDLQQAKRVLEQAKYLMSGFAWNRFWKKLASSTCRLSTEAYFTV
jgi:hypothetical protein